MSEGFFLYNKIKELNNDIENEKYTTTPSACSNKQKHKRDKMIELRNFYYFLFVFIFIIWFVMLMVIISSDVYISPVIWVIAILFLLLGSPFLSILFLLIFIMFSNNPNTSKCRKSKKRRRNK